MGSETLLEGDDLFAEIEIYKRGLILNLLLNDYMVTLYVDPSVNGVVVHESCYSASDLYIHLWGEADYGQIGRFSVDKTLELDGEPYDCVIPYSAIYGIQCPNTLFLQMFDDAGQIFDCSGIDGSTDLDNLIIEMPKG